MTRDQINKNVVKSSLTSYLRIIVRMGLGLVTFRLLYQGLTTVPEQFGFWSLLWAVFGYGILLDFGFGYSAQKRVAELSVKRDWTQLSRVLSTIFFFYLLTAAAAFALGVIFSGPLIDLFKVSAAHHEEYRRVMIVFLGGIGLAFPFGIFPEVLQGQQRIMVANNLNMLGTAANFVCVACVIYFQWSFMTLVVLSLLCILLPYLLAAWLSLAHMPGVRIRPNLFSFHTMLDTGKFSVYAYANTLSNVIRNKADQPIISSILGVAAVTPYQAGSKVGEMFGLLTRQIAEVLTPTAAHLHAKGDAHALREMMINGMRFSILAATPLYVITAFYIEGVIRILTGVKHPTLPMIWSGEILLFWYYSLVLTHWVFKNMFMMAGQEKRMMLQSVLEGVLNFTLSIGLTFWIRHTYGGGWGILGVALGSAIPTFVFGWGLLFGWAAHEAGISRWELFRRVMLKSWLGCLPMVPVALALRLQPFWASGSNTLLVLGEGAVVGAVGLLGVWFIGFNRVERRTYADKIRRRFQANPLSAPVRPVVFPDDPARARPETEPARPAGRARILYLDAPFENEPGGDKNRSRFLFQALRERFEVDLILMSPNGAPARPAWTRFNPLAMFTPQPAPFPSPAATPVFAGSDVEKFRGLLRAGRYDAVFSRFCTGWELCKIVVSEAPQTAVIVDMDMISSRLVALAWAADRSFKRRWFLFEKWKLERLERQLVHAPILLLLSNPEELAALHRRNHSPGSKSKSALLPNNMPRLAPAGDVPRRPVILFFGSMDSAANTDGFAFLLDEVLSEIEPELKRHNAVIHVVGKHPPAHFHERLVRSGTDRVTIIGRVDSIERAIAESLFVLLPLRIASGTRTRILEAAAQRRAVVTTPIGVEGLDLADTVLTGSSAPALADQVRRLLADPGAADRLGEKLGARAASLYGPEKVAGDLVHTVENFIHRKNGGV